MICKNCGREIASDISFCPNCGTVVEKPEPVRYQAYEPNLNDNSQQSFQNNIEPTGPLIQKKNSMATASMILGIVSIATFYIGFISIPCGIIGLILSFISYKQPMNFKPNRDKAVAGIICSCIGLFLSIIFTLFIIVVAKEIILHSDEISDFARQFENDLPNGYYQFDYGNFNY